MVKRRAALVILLAIALLTSCSRTKIISQGELRSDTLSAISLAAETELFIGQVQQHRVTQHFERGHLEYLREEAAQQAKELRQSDAAPALAPKLETCRSQLESLGAGLATLKKDPTDVDRLSALKQQAARMLTELEPAIERR